MHGQWSKSLKGSGRKKLCVFYTLFFQIIYYLSRKTRTIKTSYDLGVSPFYNLVSVNDSVHFTLLEWLLWRFSRYLFSKKVEKTFDQSLNLTRLPDSQIDKLLVVTKLEKKIKYKDWTKILTNVLGTTSHSFDVSSIIPLDLSFYKLHANTRFH